MLTAVEITDKGFIADVSTETLSLTTIGNWQVGKQLICEKAMQAGDRLWGHICLWSRRWYRRGNILARRCRSWRFRMCAPAELAILPIRAQLQ